MAFPVLDDNADAEYQSVHRKQNLSMEGGVLGEESGRRRGASKMWNSFHHFDDLAVLMKVSGLDASPM